MAPEELDDYPSLGQSVKLYVIMVNAERLFQGASEKMEWTGVNIEPIFIDEYGNAHAYGISDSVEDFFVRPLFNDVERAMEFFTYDFGSGMFTNVRLEDVKVADPKQGGVPEYLKKYTHLLNRVLFGKMIGETNEKIPYTVTVTSNSVINTAVKNVSFADYK
jgi:hypothetical protein